MFYCKSINTEDANDWDWKNSLNFKSESYVSCKLKDCNLQLTIREVLWGVYDSDLMSLCIVIKAGKQLCWLLHIHTTED